MGRRFGGRKESRKVKRRKFFFVELEEKGVGRVFINLFVFFEMYIFGKRGEGLGSRDTRG